MDRRVEQDRRKTPNRVIELRARRVGIELDRRIRERRSSRDTSPLVRAWFSYWRRQTG